jgi:hypothetical protein
VLSEHEAFEGEAWCSTAAESENGWREAWTMCTSSPAAFNQIGRFMGVLHIACAEVPMQALKDTIINFKIASEEAGPFTTNVPDLSIPESYVVRALLRLFEGHFLRLTLDPNAITFVISGWIPILETFQRPPIEQVLPVIYFQSPIPIFGRPDIH